MQPYEYIQIFSTFIWTIIPFFRYKSKHFLFFLFAGLSDSIGLSLWYTYHLSSQITWIPLFYLIVFGIDRGFFLKHYKSILIGFIVILFVNYYSTTYQQSLFVLLSYIIITIIFSRNLYWELIKNNKISLFYTVMTFYGLFSTYKLVLAVSNINLGLNAYYATTFIQIFIGLFLIFVRKDYQFALKD